MIRSQYRTPILSGGRRHAPDRRILFRQRGLLQSECGQLLRRWGCNKHRSSLVVLLLRHCEWPAKPFAGTDGRSR